MPHPLAIDPREPVRRRKPAAATWLLAAWVAGSSSMVPATGVSRPDARDPASPTGYVYHPDFLLHDPGPRHPERPARLLAIDAALRADPVSGRLVTIAPRLAETRWLTAVHRPEYLETLERAAGRAPVAFDPDTVVSSESYRVARLAAGGVLAAVDAVMEGRVRNAFVAARPPGHHAFADRASGFCLINNVAVAARYIQRRYGLTRVLIVDWDVHHGNATQEIFYEDGTVLYFSTHQHPFYPGTGAAEETGRGAGVGTNVNVPLPAGAGDAELRAAFASSLVPAAVGFAPEFVLVSAGFDSHAGDPLAGFQVSTAGFAELTRITMDIAERFAGGRMVSVLEGGYRLENLASAAVAHVRTLAEGSAPR